jgi:IS30 family transposase
MRKDKDGEWEWILQVKDHFSRFIWLFALKDKSSAGVAAALDVFISFCGEMHICQMDNGTEFKRKFLRILECHRCHVINGSPYQPATQGSVENANGSFKRRLRAVRMSTSYTGWKDLLSQIMRITNTTNNAALPRYVSPYEVFFGRKPRYETKKADLDEVWVDWLEDSDEQEELVRVSEPPSFISRAPFWT